MRCVLDYKYHNALSNRVLSLKKVYHMEGILTILVHSQKIQSNNRH